MRWRVTQLEHGQRLIAYLRQKQPHLSAAAIKKQLDQGLVRCGSQVERFGKRPVKFGEEVVCQEELSFAFDRTRLLFEDELLFVYNKPTGCRVVEDLLPLLQKSYPSLQPVHRLDRETTGVLLFAKSEEICQELIALFHARLVSKEYLALVAGKMEKAEGTRKSLLVRRGEQQWQEGPRGVPATMLWQCLKATEEASFLCCQPVTGRTHQLRVQLQGMGHPIIGDRLYAHYPWNLRAERLMLHAASLSLPWRGKNVHFQAALPREMRQMQRQLDL